MSLQIETERLILRDPREEDIPVMLKLFGEPESKNQILSIQSDEEYNRKGLAATVEWTKFPERDFYTLIAERKEDKAVIGDCSLWKVRRESYGTSIGWHYGIAYQGKGYATEAARAMLEFGFRKKGVALIYADCFEDNLKSMSVIRKLGMTPQWNFGVFNLLRGFSYKEFRPTIRHSITRDDWFEQQKA